MDPARLLPESVRPSGRGGDGGVGEVCRERCPWCREGFPIPWAGARVQKSRCRGAGPTAGMVPSESAVASLRFSEEDKEHMKRRAALVMLVRPDTVSAEQLALLSSVAAEEAARNRAALPSLDAYGAFLR
jgi:hypothetical protein